MLAHLRRLGPITSAELRKNAPRFFLTPDTLKAANPYPYPYPYRNLGRTLLPNMSSALIVSSWLVSPACTISSS